jgi:hypothetical protein
MKTKLWAILFTVCFVVPIVRADTFTWIGSQDNDWFNASNWSGGLLPVQVSGTNPAIIFQSGSFTPLITGTMSYQSQTYSGNTDYTVNVTNTFSSGASMGSVINTGTAALIYNVSGRINGMNVASGMVVLNSGTLNGGSNNISVGPNTTTTTQNPYLVLNGLATSSGAFTLGVNNNPTYTSILGGTGTLQFTNSANGVVLVQAPSNAANKGNIIRPGNPMVNSGIGTLTINSKLRLQDGQSASFNVFEFQIDSLSNYDQIIVSGVGATTGNGLVNGVSFGISIGKFTKLSLEFLEPSNIQIGDYDLISYGNQLLGWSNLTFDTNTQTFLDSLAGLGYSYSLQNVLNDISDPTQGGRVVFSISAIPEPASLVLFVVGVMILIVVTRLSVIRGFGKVDAGGLK